MRPVFADPKTDFVFKKLFGSEEHKDLLIALLNALLELDDNHLIKEVTLIPTEQRPLIDGMKLSIVDVKCRDVQGITYVVEMQILKVEGFDKRVVYNACKAYTSQLRTGEDYPLLNDVVAISICDFVMWAPDAPASQAPERASLVPMLSRWRMQEQHSGAVGLPQIQHVFLELPKYRGGSKPTTIVEKWAYFFRCTQDLTMVPEVLNDTPIQQAMELARTAQFSAEEWEAYDRAKMAEQDARGALTVATREARAEGRIEGKLEVLCQAIEDLCEVLAIELTEERTMYLRSRDLPQLEEFRALLKKHRAWPG